MSENVEKVPLNFERPLIQIEKKIEELRRITDEGRIDFSDEIEVLKQRAQSLRAELFSNLDAWGRTQISRHSQRPYLNNYIEELLDDWVELHGDRNYMDDASIVGGLGTFRGRSVMVVGHLKGRNTKENMLRNFGMSRPEGYRKALRLFSMAERFRLPILTFVDTPGAYPGIGAEERGQAEAIAKNVMVLSKLKTPILVTVIGEGGSGGALAIGVGDRILMLENAIYSVISPEACASILWRDGTKGELAARALRYTASDCSELGIADEIIPEPLGGAHQDPSSVIAALGDVLDRHLTALESLSDEELVAQRYDKLRGLGAMTTAEAEA